MLVCSLTPAEAPVADRDGSDKGATVEVAVRQGVKTTTWNAQKQRSE